MKPEQIEALNNIKKQLDDIAMVLEMCTYGSETKTYVLIGIRTMAECIEKTLTL